MSLSKTQIFLFFESGNYVKATRRLSQHQAYSVYTGHYHLYPPDAENAWFPRSYHRG